MDQNNFQTDDVYSISVKHANNADVSNSSREMANDLEMESHYMPYEQSKPVASNYPPNYGRNGANSVSGMQHWKIILPAVILLLVLSALFSIVCLVFIFQMKQELIIIARTHNFSYNDLKSQISEESAASFTEAKNVQENIATVERKLLNLTNSFSNDSKALSFKIERITSYLTPTSCRDTKKSLAKVSNKTGGVFTIISHLVENPTEVFCDMTTDNGGWIVFQRRIDGSVDFNRTWTDYVNGFGDKQGEFWLGLESIHQFTRSGNYELRIDMIQDDTARTRRYAKFSSFSMGDRSTKYTLSVTYRSGTLYDGLYYNNGKKFSTKDEDNDGSAANNCARDYGGWWYPTNCYNTYLNSGFEEIKWRNYNLRSTEMKFRQIL